MSTIIGYKILFSTNIVTLNDRIEALVNSHPVNALWQPYGRPRFDQDIWIQPMALVAENVNDN